MFVKTFKLLHALHRFSLGLLAVYALTGCGGSSAPETGKVALKQAPESLLQHINNPQQSLSGSAIRGRAIVKFKTDYDDIKSKIERVDRLGRSLNRKIQYGRSLGSRTQSLQAEATTSAEFAKALAALPEVEWAVEDKRRLIRSIPNDPLFASNGTMSSGVKAGQWFLRAPDPTMPSAIDAQRAWDRQKGSSNVVVAVLDTGVVLDHPDLVGKLLPGYDFVSDRFAASDGTRRDNDPSDPGDASVAGECNPYEPAQDSSWHGTQVAGLIAASTDNGIGVASVGRNVSVLPVRVLGQCGGYDSDIIAGMLWAGGVSSDVGLGRTVVYPNAHPARVINISLGSQGTCSIAYSDAIKQLRQRGVTVIAAAGNDVGFAVSTPANCEGVIAVTGIRHLGTKVGYSNVGPQISVAAPAGNCVNLEGPCLYPLVTTSNAGATIPGAHIYSDGVNITVGTSFAAPLVAATAALMLSANPGLSPNDIQNIIKRTARPFPLSGAEADVKSCKSPSLYVEQLECYCTTSTCGAGLLNTADAVNFAADLAESGLAYRSDVDRYNPETNQLQIAKVTVGAFNYYNVIVTLDKVIALGDQGGRRLPSTRFDTNSGILEVAEVSFGKNIFYNVSVTLKDVLQIGVP